MNMQVLDCLPRGRPVRLNDVETLGQQPIADGVGHTQDLRRKVSGGALVKVPDVGDVVVWHDHRVP
jgi:hypothetical protein